MLRLYSVKCYYYFWFEYRLYQDCIRGIVVFDSQGYKKLLFEIDKYIKVN